MDIRSKNDLRVAYNLIYTMGDLIETVTGIKDRSTVLKAVEGLKRDVRAYNRKESDRVCIFCDMDGYTELIQFPDYVETLEECEQWFDEVERLTYIPSQYDCTGQHFTRSHKFVNRGGRWFCYHTVAVDL